MTKKWYIVHAYSNFEHRVKAALDRAGRVALWREAAQRTLRPCLLTAVTISIALFVDFLFLPPLLLLLDGDKEEQPEVDEATGEVKEKKVNYLLKSLRRHA